MIYQEMKNKIKPIKILITTKEAFGKRHLCTPKAEQIKTSFFNLRME